MSVLGERGPKHQPKVLSRAGGTVIRGELVITLALGLPSESNARGHWAEKARRASAARGLASLATRAYSASYCGVPVFRWFGGTGIVVTLVRLAPRELDDDNVRGALKSVRDGVADALGLASDRDKRVTWRYEQRKGASREYGCEIRIGQR
jgi:hypothetical protein